MYTFYMHYSKQELINILTKRKSEIKKRLDDKMRKFAKADSGRTARFPTGRVELEAEILSFKQTISNIDGILYDIEQIQNRNKESDSVNIGSVVTIDINGTEKSFLVLQNGLELSLGIISIESPLGKSLYNAKKGDTVTYETPTESKNALVKSIKWLE